MGLHGFVTFTAMQFACWPTCTIWLCIVCCIQKECKNNISLPDGENARQLKLHKRDRRGNSCYYCREHVGQIPRHLCRHHTDIPEVCALLCKSGKERKLALLKVRNLGNFSHNITVLESGTGTLRVSRVTRLGMKQNECYLPCVHCYAFYDKSQLWRHVSCSMLLTTLGFIRKHWLHV
jgi:hypothetical protein